MVKELLAGSADPTAVDERGDSALHCAARQGNIAVVQTLLLAGSNFRALNRDGWKPAHVARHAGHGELADLITVFGGGRPSKPTEQGRFELVPSSERRFLSPQPKASTAQYQYRGSSSSRASVMFDSDSNTPMHNRGHAICKDSNADMFLE